MSDPATNSQVAVDPVILMYAFRYALGRKTYCVGDVAAALITHIALLKPDWRQQILQDIDLAIADERAGDDRHVARWREVAEAMRHA
jgi:hypothetical protein